MRQLDQAQKPVSIGHGWSKWAFRSTLAVICGAMLLHAPGHAQAELKVVATIAPLHSLATGIFKGAGTPDLLIRGTHSPHGYKLRPSEIDLLGKADIVIGVDESFETGLKRPISRLNGKTTVLWLAEIGGMRRYHFRGSGLWPREAMSGQAGEPAAENPGNPRHRDHEESFDPHLWLDPANAMKFVTALADLAAERDKIHADTIRKNAAELNRRLRELDLELRSELASVHQKPFIVYHDAYQYFEKRYDLGSWGAVASDAHIQPGARHLVQLRNIFKSGRVKCLFTEAQFPPGLARRLIEGTPARLGALDPLGAAIAPGPDHYFKLMRNLAAALKACFEGTKRG